MVSAMGQQAMVIEAIRSGAADFIVVKPSSPIAYWRRWARRFRSSPSGTLRESSMGKK